MGRRRGKQVRRALALLGLVAVLAACDTQQWLQPDGDASHRRNNSGARTITPANVGSLVESWHVDGPDKRFAVGDAVYGVSGTELYLLDPKTGDGGVVWSTTPEEPITGGPFIDGPNEIRLSYGDALGVGHEAVFDPSRYPVDGLLTLPIFGFLTARRDGHSVRLRAVSPDEPWTSNEDNTSWVQVSGAAMAGQVEDLHVQQATFGPDLLYLLVPLGLDDARVFAYDPTEPCPNDACEAVWVSEPFRNLDTRDMAVTDDGATLVLAGDGVSSTIALNAHTGARKWASAKRHWAFGAATAGDSIYVASGVLGGPRALYVLSAETGAEKWTGDLSAASNFPGVTAIGGSVVYAALGSTVAAFPTAGCGASTCQPVWTANAGAIVRSIAVAQGHVYVQASNGITAYGLPS